MTKTASYVDPDFDNTGYGLIDLGGRTEQLTAERFLWLWVILQALMDIGLIAPITTGGRTRPNTGSLEYLTAARWLTEDRRDFLLTCEMAGVSPFAIRAAVQAFMGRKRVV